MKKKTTVTSTTGTAPLEFVAGDRPGEIYIFTEDGAGQVYTLANLARAIAYVGGLDGNDPEE